MDGRNCEECDGNRVKISEMEQRIRRFEEGDREDSEESSNEDSMDVEQEQVTMELQAQIARLEAEVHVWRTREGEAREVIKEKNEVIGGMATDMERFKKEKDDVEEKWQDLKEKMGKIMEYCREGGNNMDQEKHNEEIQEERREKIIVVGDSHMTFIKGNMKMKDKDILVAKSGAGIKEVMGKAVGQAREAGGRAVLFICGGGNSLNVLGRKATIEEVLVGLREIKKEEEVRVVMLSIFPRPSQTAVYEEARVEANAGIKEGIERLREEGQNIEFLELDEVLGLGEELFERRLIHLNWEGMRKLGRKMSGKLEGAEKIEEEEENENQASAPRREGLGGTINRGADEGRGRQNRDQVQEKRRNEEIENMRGDSNYSNFVRKMDRGRGNGGYMAHGNRGRGGYGDRGEMGRGQGSRGRGGSFVENRGGRGGDRGRGSYSSRGAATYGGPVYGGKSNNGEVGGRRGRGN